MPQKMTDPEFIKYFEKKVRNTIRKYKLLDRKEKAAVAVSGGKDSTACIYMIKKLGYDVEGITINPSIGEFSKKNTENLVSFCKKNDIKLHEFSFKKEFGLTLRAILSRLKKKGKDCSSCMICGILKRYLLNKYSKKLKFDVIATGHNLDDEAQAFLMNIFRNDFTRAIRQGPVSGIVRSKKFVRRVKPLYLVSEAEVIRYTRLKKFPVKYGRCPCSNEAYRRQFIDILDKFEKKHPPVKYNIVRFHEAMAKNIIAGNSKENEQDIISCEACGEPSSQKRCKACLILDELGLKP